MVQFTNRENYNFSFNEFIKCFIRPNRVQLYGIHRPASKVVGKYCDV